MLLTAASLGDGDKGDITVTGTGTVWTIDNAAVTLAKLANLSTATFIGRSTPARACPRNSRSAPPRRCGTDGNDSGDVTLSGSLDYLTLASQVITVGAIDLATDTTGLLARNFSEFFRF